MIWILILLLYLLGSCVSFAVTTYLDPSDPDGNREMAFWWPLVLIGILIALPILLARLMFDVIENTMKEVLRK